MRNRVAIDFGTTNSIVAITHDDQTQLLEVSMLSEPGSGIPLIPSLVYIAQDGPHFGHDAQEIYKVEKSENRLFRNFKRAIVGELVLPQRTIDNRSWPQHDIAALFLQQIFASLPPPVEQIVMTVPIVAFDPYIAWLEDVTRQSNISPDTIHIVDEATAAAIGYAVKEAGAPVMVIDFGGGTLDLSLVQLPQHQAQPGGILSFLRQHTTSDYRAQVIARAGSIIGGSDIDQWLLDVVLEELGIDKVTSGNNISNWLAICEQVKIQLSSGTEAQLVLEVDGKPASLQLTRERFNQILIERGLYDVIRRAIDQIMSLARQRGIFKEDIRHVLMVGGTSLIPAIQAYLRDYFTDEAVRGDKPFTAVAEGALQLTDGIGLQDYLMHTCVLRYLDMTEVHRFEEIIPMGASYPTDSVDILLEAAYKNQTTIEIVVGEVGFENISMLKLEREHGQVNYVAQPGPSQEVVTLLNEGNAPQLRLDPPAQLGGPRLKATFIVDAHRHLKVDVTDLQTGKHLLVDYHLAVLR